MKVFVFMLCFLLGALNASAAIQKQTIEYKDGDTTLEGFFVYDDAIKGKQPGVVVVHDWMGFGPYANGRAEQLASLGYAALAIDIYGKGVRPKDQSEAARQAGIFKSDRALMRSRAKAGLDALMAQPVVDTQRVAAIGYCFGGTTVLEMARAGMPLAGVVSFHGGLDTSMGASKGDVKASILVLHGADDPHVPPAEVAKFQNEMNGAGADWQIIFYSGAVHSFTHEAAGNDPSKGAAYNKRADLRSWVAMKSFFSELFD